MEDRIQSISSEEHYSRKYNDFTSNSPPSKVSKENIDMSKENKIKLEFSSDLDQKFNTVSSIFKIEYPSPKESEVLVAEKNKVATDCKLDLTLLKLENENSEDTDHDLEESCLNELMAKIEPDIDIVTSDTYNDLNIENRAFINEDKGSDAEADRLEIEAENEGELSDGIYSDALSDFKSEIKQDFENHIAIDDACSELRDQNKLSQQSTESKHGSCTEDGELQDNDDLEEGEVKDDEEGSSNPLQTCRFFQRGSCSFGASCRFMHITDKGLYRMFETKEKECFRSVNANNIREEFGFRNVILPPPPPLISEVIEFRDLAWERGLRLAKEQQRRALQRKSEPDFEEKNLYMNFNESNMHLNEKSHSLSMHERHYRRTSIDICTINEKKIFNSCEDKHTGKPFIQRNRINTIYGPMQDQPVAKKARLSNDTEWRDPWRRSKSPRKGYRSRSYSSSSASYSSCSSNCSCQSTKYSYHEKKFSYKKSSSKKDCGHKRKSRSPIRRSSPKSCSRSPTSQSMSSSPTERFRKEVYRNPKKLDPSCFASNSRRSASLEKAITSSYGPVQAPNPKKNSKSPVQKFHSPIKSRITHRSLSRSSTSSSCQSYKTCSRSRSASSTSSSRSKKSNSFSSHYSVTSNYSSKSYSKDISKKRSISPRRISKSRSPPKEKTPNATKLSFSLSRTSRKILNFNVPWLKKEQEKITIHYSPKKAGKFTSHHLAKTNFRRNERENITSHNSAKATFRKNEPENINSRYVTKSNSSKDSKNGVIKPSSLAKSTSVKKLTGNKAACMLMQYRNLVDSNAQRGNENVTNLNKSTKNAVTTLNQGTTANKDTTVKEVHKDKTVNEGATLNKAKEINKIVSAKATPLNKQTSMNMGTSLKNETTPNNEKGIVSFETPKKGPRMSCAQLFSQYEALTKKTMVKSKNTAPPKLKNGNALGENKKCPQGKKQSVATPSSTGTNTNLIPNENKQNVFVHPAKRIVPNSKSRTITMNLLTDVMKPPDKKTLKSVTLAVYKPMQKEKGTSRRDLLLKQLKAVEDAIARKKAKSD